jgi:hypothetical protein
MTTQHTPGPWAQSIGDDDWHQIISHPDGEGLIADVNAYKGSPKGRANARLIASAPELLAALQSLLLTAEQLNEELEKATGIDICTPSAIHKALAAISKATNVQLEQTS